MAMIKRPVHMLLTNKTIVNLPIHNKHLNKPIIWAVNLLRNNWEKCQMAKNIWIKSSKVNSRKIRIFLQQVQDLFKITYQTTWIKHHLIRSTAIRKPQLALWIVKSIWSPASKILSITTIKANIRLTPLRILLTNSKHNLKLRDQNLTILKLRIPKLKTYRIINKRLIAFRFQARLEAQLHLKAAVTNFQRAKSLQME